MKKLSIIIPVRNRNIFPLLHSLAKYERDIEVIPVYYNSGLWNISRAANIGIRGSHGELVAKVDADLIIPDGFIDDVLSAGKCFGVAPVIMLGKGDSFEAASYLPVHRPPDGSVNYWPCGGWQSAPRDFWFDIHGYDEDMILYGAEDTDMMNRAAHSGLKCEVFHPIPHCWHDSQAGKHTFFHRGNARMREARIEMPVRNRKGWGGNAPRPGLEFCRWALNALSC